MDEQRRPQAVIRRGAPWLVASLALLALVTAGSALGDQTTIPDTAGDSFYCGAPTDPCPPEFDLRSATAGHGTTTNLQHRFEYYGADPQGHELEIYVTSSTIGQPDYYTLPGADPTQRRLMNAGRQQVGTVVVATLGPTTVLYTFGASEIGNPSTYRWRAIDMGENVGPDGPADPAKVHDSVPSGALATHVLSAGGGGGAQPAPVRGRTVNVTVRRGIVRVKRPGARSFTRLQGSAQIPVRSFLDTKRGTVGLTSAVDAQGATQSADFFSGQFQVLQSRTSALTTLRLSEALGPCPRASGSAQTSRVRRRRLWGRGRGRFRTRGRYSAAVVRGTTWLTQDTCNTTLTRVTVGRVAVRDFVRRTTINLRAGQSYLARPRR